MAASSLALSRRSLLLSALSRPLSIGGIRFFVEKNGRSRRRYLHIHGNESTARDLLRDHLKSHKGTFFFVDSQTRHVPVGACLIDPNRMFTALGAARSLKRINPSASPAQIDAALALLAHDRERFLRAVIPPPGGLLIALHNNSEGYNVQDEIPTSDQVHLPDPDHPRDFVLATNEEDFHRASRGSFNIVLQKSVRSDDGSFSVLAASRGIRYINVEAALGNYSKQKEILDFLESVLA